MLSRAGRLAVLGCLWVCLPALHAETPEEVFHRANEAYEKEDYDQAAELYASLLRYRIRDPLLEYNLANAEFRLGRLGQAILHYERARRLDPTDQDIRANLAFARSQGFDRVEAPDPPAALRWFLAGQERLGPDRQAWGALALVWVLGGLVAWCSARPGGWSARHGWVLAALALALAAVAASWSWTYQRLEGRTEAVVLAEVVDVLAGPGESNPALFTVHEGLTLEVHAEREEWLQVRLPNGLNGWIGRDAVGIV